MNKKVFAIVLIVLIAMTSAFAYKGETKIGLDIGTGSDNLAYDDNKNRATAIEMGANITGSIQYGLSDSSAVKFELGLNTYSEGTIYVNDKADKVYDISDRDPNAVFYLGLVYNLSIGRSGLFEWEFGAGLQGTAGSCFLGNKQNLSLGIGFEESFVFNISNSFAITATTRAGIQFVNTNKEYRDYLESVNSLSIPVYITAGVTYSL